MFIEHFDKFTEDHIDCSRLQGGALLCQYKKTPTLAGAQQTAASSMQMYSTNLRARSHLGASRSDFMAAKAPR